MKLSNKKIKYIHRHAGAKTPETIARELRIHLKDVEEVLGISKTKSPEKIKVVLDGIFRGGLFLLSFFAPFIFLDGLYDFANLPQMAFIQTGVVVVFLLWLIKGAVSGKCTVVRSPFNLPIFGFILWSLISLAYAHNKYEGIMLWMHWAACALMFFLVLNGTREKKDSIRLMAVILVSGSLTALLGITQHLFELSELSWIPQVAPPAATFANKNMAVHFIILTCPLAFGFILNSENKVQTWVPSVASALMAVYLVYTGTQAGWVALAVQIVFFSAMMIRERFQKTGETYWNKQKTLAAAAAVIVIFLMIDLGAQDLKKDLLKLTSTQETTNGSSKPSSEAYTSSALLRMHIWLNTLIMIKDRPLTGFGLGNHKVFYPLYFRKVVKEKQFSETSQLTNVHNDFLQMGAELGLVGMLLLGWLGFLLTRTVLFLTRSGNSGFVRFSTIGISVAMVGFLVNACFSFPVHRAIPPFVMMSLTGLLASFYDKDARRWHTIRQRWIILGACVIVFAGLIWLINFHRLGIKCDRHYLEISRLEKSKNWKGVVEEGRWAYSYFPERVKILSYIGRAYIEMGKPREGIEVLKKVIRAYPNHMNALLNIGVAYGNIREHPRALEAYEKVLRIKPDYAKVHNNMANIYMQQKNPDKALVEFKIAAKLDPENSVIHFNVGIVEMQKKRYREAAEAFEKAVKSNPGWDLAHKNLGIAYFQFLNRQKDGLVHLKKALELNPKIADAKHMRDLIKGFEK